MKRLTVWALVATGAFFLLLGAPSAHAQESPTCTVRNVTDPSASTFEKGDQIAVMGGKFDANALVKVIFVQGGSSVELAQVRTGSDGNFDTSALGTKLPSSASKGSASISATGKLNDADASCAVAIDIDGLPSTGFYTQILGVWGFALLGGGSIMLGASRSKVRRRRTSDPVVSVEQPRRNRRNVADKPARGPRNRRDPVGPPELVPIELEPAFADAFTPEPSAWEQPVIKEQAPRPEPVVEAEPNPHNDAVTSIDELLREWES
jgi:hypothetical protein